MGRPRVHDEGVSVAIWLDKDMIRRLDAIAEKADISRSKLISNLLESGLDDAELLAKAGIIDLVMLVDAFKKRMKQTLQGQANLVEAIKPMMG